MYFLLRSEAQSNTCNFKNLSPKVGNILVFGKWKSTDLVNKQKNAEFPNLVFLFINIICQANFFT